MLGEFCLRSPQLDPTLSNRSQGRVSPAMVVRSVMDPAYVPFHISARDAGTSASKSIPAARLLSKRLQRRRATL